MESVVSILMILVCFNFILKQTLVARTTMFVSVVVLSLFVALVWNVAIEQSKTQISAWLADSALMLDIAVVLSIDVIVQLAYCIFVIRVPQYRLAKRRTRIVGTLLTMFPGVAIFPIVFGILVEAIFTLTGTSFQLIAYGMSAIILLLVPTAVLLLRKFVGEREVRIEMLFLSEVLVAMFGILATVNGNVRNSHSNDIDWLALAGFILLFIILASVGFAFHTFKNKKRIKKREQQ